MTKKILREDRAPAHWIRCCNFPKFKSNTKVFKVKIKVKAVAGTMGGNYGSDVIAYLAGMSKQDIRDIGMEKIRACPNFPSGQPRRRHPVISVDCNNVIHIVGANKFDPVAATANFLDEWAHHGFIIEPVVDRTSPNAK